MHSIKDTVKQLIGKSLDAYNKKYTSPINNRIDNIVAQAGTDNTEIVDARIDSAGVSHTTLNNRILAETKMTDEKLIEYTGSSLSVDDTMPGYLQNIEIKGNTIQNEDNLEDIRSVGDKIEGQELYEIPVLSCGKNLINKKTLKEMLHTYIQDEDGSKIKLNYVSMTSNRFEVPLSLVGNYTISYQCKETVGGKNPKLGFRYSDGSASYNTSFVATSNYSTYNHFSNGKDVVGLCITYNNTGGDFWVDLDSIQLEEGIVATEYEPYQEDKLTILSPVQLEKVGDVSDRLIEKDGVWGVEKNIETKYLKDMPIRDNVEEATHYRLGNYSDTFPMRNDTILCNNYVVATSASTENTQTQIMAFKHSNTRTEIRLAIQKSDVPDITTINELVSRVKNGDTYIKYQLVEPTFIPLPHDQQVKLRTFANKTNISFLTEIEGTIKAQVPKSLGATVNTHTTQISNLNKELDRVKKLEESTVSTVTTESDFTTVEATSNGYFEDVKLEGKTLVNLWDINKMNKVPSISVADNYVTVNADGSWIDCHPRYTAGKVPMLKPNTEYTVITHIKNNTLDSYMSLNVDNANRSPFTRNVTIEQGFTGYYICKLTTKTDLSNSDTSLRCQIGSGCTTGTVVFNCILLEGDHTQNLSSGYFEGLKSVGQGTDEIVVSSVNDNLFTCINTPVKMGGIDSNSVITNLVKTDTGFSATSSKERYGIEYAFISKTEGYIYVKTEGNINSHISIWNSSKGISQSYTTIATNYVKFPCKNGELFQIGIRCSATGVFSVENIYVAYSEIETNKCSLLDKKRLLFYNNETQTWEKPILRQWDSIEKHADGKYYYHQRSGEVVLNGSENWSASSTDDTKLSMQFILANYPLNIAETKDHTTPQLISDTIPATSSDAIGSSTLVNEVFGIAVRIKGNEGIFIALPKSKLSTQDLAGFKQLLQTNNVTVVYQLAQEKVYECTNIDLITYANETNYVVESGSIVPRSTLKVHNNISNVVSLLQKKVSLLESNMTKYMITQNRMQLASTYSADSVTFKVDYALCSEEVKYNEDLYNLILNNILVGKDNYDYDKMFNIILDYASWNQISWEQFDILVGVIDMQHNPPVEDEVIEEIPNEII